MHNKILRKALTKPIWWYETSRSYPVRNKAFELPPLHTNANPYTILLVLTTPQTIPDAVWAAQSMMRNLPPDMGLLFVIDGELKSAQESRLRKVFPNVLLEKTSKHLDALRSTAPNVFRFGHHHPLGRKLASILVMQRIYNVVYSDADVLCFRPVPELCRAISDFSPPLYIQDIGKLNSDPVLLARVNSRNRGHAQTLNSGLLFVPKEALLIASAEEVLQENDYDLNSWFTEQTVLAVLMHEAGAQPLPRSHYVVSSQRQFYFEKDVDYDQIAVRHFVGPVRHLMYSTGIPRLARQWMTS